MTRKTWLMLFQHLLVAWILIAENISGIASGFSAERGVLRRNHRHPREIIAFESVGGASVTTGIELPTAHIPDYAKIVEDLLWNKQPQLAIETLEQWQDERSLSRPPLLLITKAIRTLVNTPSEERGDIVSIGIKRAELASDIAHRMLDNSIDTSDKFRVRQLHFAVQEAWSKALPTPAQQRRQKLRVSREDREKIATQAEDWHRRSMQLGNRSAANSLLLFTQCKCGKVDEAWATWQVWMSNLEQDKSVRIDVRSFSMLITCLSMVESNEQTNSTLERAATILDRMWKLDEMGFRDVTPDAYLYTTLVTMCAHLGLAKEASRLVEDVEKRHYSLRLKSLKPDVALYNALVSAVAKQPLSEAGVSIAEQAGAVVKKMERISQEEGNEGLAPDTITYNTLLDACLRTPNQDKRDGIERADQTLTWMREESQKGNSRVQPNFRSFATVIKSFANQAEESLFKDDASSTARAEKWLDRMEEKFVPSAALFEEVILSCCRQSRNNSTDLPAKKQQAARAQRLLSRMEELYQVGATSDLRPDQSLYDSVIEAWVACGESGTVEVERLRESKKQMYPTSDEASNEGAKPLRFSSNAEIFALLGELGLGSPWKENRPPIASTLSFNRVIKEIASSGKPWAGQRAEDILFYMLQNSLKRGDQRTVPDIVTVNSVILAWSKSMHADAAARAYAVLARLKALHDKGFLLDVQADLVSYNNIIHAYASNKLPKQSERVFGELTRLSTKDERFKPDILSYSSLLNAFANVGAARRAEEILLNMQKDHKADPSQVCPNTACYNQVLYAWSKSSEQGAGKRAEMLLRLMEDMPSPGSTSTEVVTDTQSYNIVLHALCNSGDSDAPLRGELLLERMKESFDVDEERLKPDACSYTTLIAAWCKLGGTQGLQATERLVNEALSTEGVVTEQSFFSNVLYSMANCINNKMPQKAEELMKKAASLNVECDIEAFNALLNCWAKSGSRDSSNRTQEILNRLEMECASSKKLCPTVETYTIVLDALAKSRDDNSVLDAEDILKKMEKSSRIKPNVHTYTAMIQNYARSKDPFKSIKAQKILSRMKEGNDLSHPNTITYNAVLNACEYTPSTEIKEMEEAFRVACAAFEEMRASNVKPNHITYGSFLGVIANHMPKSDVRNNLVELVFRRCCADGQVSTLVMRKLLDASTSFGYSNLLQGHSKNTLPSEWTRNVRER
jgi:hypothetical protein